MTKLFILIGVLVAIAVVATAVLSLMSRQAPALGLQTGKLQPCDARPNCVCSEYGAAQSDARWVSALDAKGLTAEQAWAGARHAIAATGGEIVREEHGYLRAEYVSALVRFVDDLELRWDATQQVLHLRSASRVGHSDLGVNRKRVAALREAFLAYRASLSTEPQE